MADDSMKPYSNCNQSHYHKPSAILMRFRLYAGRSSVTPPTMAIRGLPSLKQGRVFAEVKVSLSRRNLPTIYLF